MDWFRAHHGISQDVKIGIIAAKLDVPKCAVGWVWMILLDHASQNQDRGNIGNLQADEVALIAGIDQEKAERILDGFRGRGMLAADGRLTSWDRRQPKREREDDNSTDRVRRMRAAKKEVTDGNASETPCNATERLDKRRVDESREEENNNNAPKTGALSLVPSSDHGSVVRPTVSPRRKNRTTEEIRKALGERSLWWEEFWKVYPCHEGTRAAMDAFERRVKDRPTAEAVYRGAKAYAQRLAANPETIPKWGQGWINDERWLDENRVRDPPADRNQRRDQQVLAGMAILDEIRRREPNV